MSKDNINYAKLLDGVQKVIERGDYPKFLKMIKRLRNNYSFNNSFLVYVQNPNATIVKGFCDWNKLGRGVKKNPKTIYIYCPIKYKNKQTIKGQQNMDGKEEKDNKDNEVLEGIGYRRVAVYDISDTYVKKGEKRIPIYDDYLDADTSKDLYDILTNISPVPIIWKDDMGSAKGYYSKKEGKIFIKESLSQDDKTSVLIHELCHCMYDDFDYKNEKFKSEIFVESVAFLVADYFNFDTSLCSFGYITNWAKNDIKNFMSLSDKIKKVADEFIKQIKDYNVNQETIAS